MFAFTADNTWHVGIGDPTVMGWITVVAYFGAAVLGWKCAQQARRGCDARLSARELSAFWWFLAISLFLLGINKQLDLQTWFTLSAKRWAHAQGWYEHRRVVQVLFVFVVACGGLLAFGLAAWFMRQALRDQWLALAGMLFLGCFILIRAASFHHVDQALGFRLAGMKINWLAELGGITLIALAAGRTLRERRVVAEKEKCPKPATSGQKVGPMDASHSCDH